jgi:hypothetical protein
MTEDLENPAIGQGASAPPDADNGDTYHDPSGVLNWALRLELAAWFPLILAILSFLVLLAEIYTYMPQVIRAKAFEAYLSISIPLLIPLEATVVAAMLFLLLRAASHALLVLLDIYDKPRTG